jgi:hypothetical protein
MWKFVQCGKYFRSHAVPPYTNFTVFAVYKIVHFIGIEPSGLLRHWLHWLLLNRVEPSGLLQHWLLLNRIEPSGLLQHWLQGPNVG